MKNKDNTSKQMRGGLFSKKGLLALLSGIFISLSAVAAPVGEKPLETDAGSASRIIKEHVKFPAINLNHYQGHEEKVNVVFTVNEAGQVNLVIANTENQGLKKAIEEQFLTLSLKQLKANNAYSIQFNFKTL